MPLARQVADINAQLMARRKYDRYGTQGWAEADYNIRRWTQMPRGGHFAAFEQPELLVADVRAFYRDLR